MSYCVPCFEAIAGILQSVQDFDVQILRKFNGNSPYIYTATIIRVKL